VCVVAPRVCFITKTLCLARKRLYSIPAATYFAAEQTGFVIKQTGSVSRQVCLVALLSISSFVLPRASPSISRRERYTRQSKFAFPVCKFVLSLRTFALRQSSLAF